MILNFEEILAPFYTRSNTQSSIRLVDSERYDIVEKKDYKRQRLEEDKARKELAFEMSEKRIKVEEELQKGLAKEIADIEKELKDISNT